MAQRLKRFAFNVLRILLVSVFIFYPVVLGLDYFYVFEPYLYPLHMLQGHIRPVGRNILIGPYPEFINLERLHNQGVSVVISLLDPRLIYEKGLVRQEQHEERELGMLSYNIPLDSYESPKSPRNAAHIREILALVHSLGDRKIYIHCYLGKHRVMYVANAIRAARHNAGSVSNDRQIRRAPQD
ncbi:MAG: hypothetical protein ACYCQK_08620 [Acidiferrobacteraceae bacterium]